MLPEAICPNKDDSTVATDSEEVNTGNATCLSVQMPINSLIDLDQYNDLGQVLRITAYVLKFIKNCKPKQKVEGHLTTEEIDSSQVKSIHYMQR